METKGFDAMNRMGMDGCPFFFLIDFEASRVHVFPLDNIPADISFDFNGIKHNEPKSKDNLALEITKYPPSLPEYKKGYQAIKNRIMRGDSYLCNYTVATPISCNGTLNDIYRHAKAPFKLKYGDQFVCFSPERFVRIQGDKIFTYPMKGTMIEENINSAQLLLNNVKEQAEHYTIVDLLRNDLSKICEKVQVNDFRFLTKVKTQDKKVLLQLSSEIEGKLALAYRNKYGSIFKELLPAGSISGAPKRKTVELIKNNETYFRGYYTGVFGIFDGQELDSAVAIRFIEKTKDGLVYKSGGGLTHQSKLKEEYQEMINKIYVPVF